MNLKRRIKDFFFQLNVRYFLPIFVIVHLSFLILIQDFKALTPDENGYLYTFNALYTWPANSWAQSGSGWIAAPTFFLWVIYFPAKILSSFGIDELNAIRLQSILISTLVVYLLESLIPRKTNQERSHSGRIFLLFFYTPSVFLWSSTGLREAYIYISLALIFIGLDKLSSKQTLLGSCLLISGSYSLASTKIYLWGIMMIALLLSTCLMMAFRREKTIIIRYLAFGLLIPVILFGSTTSVYALQFIFKSDISEVGARSGDSVSKIMVDTSENTSENTSEKIEITFHGDYSLITLRNFLLDEPNAPLARVLRFLSFDKTIDKIWDDKISLGLISSTKTIGTDKSSINSHILKPGTLQDPLSIIKAAFIFLFGPLPFLGNPGLAVSISSFESPFWWLLYFSFFFVLIKARKTEFFKDGPLVVSLIFIVGFVLFSALIQVNLGTAFRHRSVILIPIIYSILRTRKIMKLA